MVKDEIRFVNKVKMILKNNFDYDAGEEQDIVAVIEKWCAHAGIVNPDNYEDCVRFGIRLMRPRKVKKAPDEEEQRDKFYAKKRKKLTKYCIYNRRRKPKLENAVKMSL